MRLLVEGMGQMKMGMIMMIQKRTNLPLCSSRFPPLMSAALQKVNFVCLERKKGGWWHPPTVNAFDD